MVGSASHQGPTFPRVSLVAGEQSSPAPRRAGLENGKGEDKPTHWGVVTGVRARPVAFAEPTGATWATACTTQRRSQLHRDRWVSVTQTVPAWGGFSEAIEFIPLLERWKQVSGS